MHSHGSLICAPGEEYGRLLHATEPPGRETRLSPCREPSVAMIGVESVHIPTHAWTSLGRARVRELKGTSSREQGRADRVRRMLNWWPNY